MALCVAIKLTLHTIFHSCYYVSASSSWTSLIAVHALKEKHKKQKPVTLFNSYKNRTEATFSRKYYGVRNCPCISIVFLKRSIEPDPHTHRNTHLCMQFENKNDEKSKKTSQNYSVRGSHAMYYFAKWSITVVYCTHLLVKEIFYSLLFGRH